MTDQTASSSTKSTTSQQLLKRLLRATEQQPASVVKDATRSKKRQRTQRKQQRKKQNETAEDDPDARLQRNVRHLLRYDTAMAKLQKASKNGGTSSSSVQKSLERQTRPLQKPTMILMGQARSSNVPTIIEPTVTKRTLQVQRQQREQSQLAASLQLYRKLQSKERKRKRGVEKK